MTETPASALLEVCVHTSAWDVPPAFTLLKVEGPDLDADSVGELPEDWRTRFDVTRALGTDWLDGGTGVLLQVPSAIVPQTANFLFNPAHLTAAQFRIAEVYLYPFDMRLKE